MKPKIVFIVLILFCYSLCGQDIELKIISVYPNQNSNTATSGTEIQIDSNLPLDTTNIIEQFIILGDMNALYPFTIQVDPSFISIG
jgi:hypothetical protein